MRRTTLPALRAVLLLAACGDAALRQSSRAPRAGFASEKAGSRKALGSTPAWHPSAAEIGANASRIHALINGKTIGADAAVQVALINNRALQANFADLSLYSAELWEAAMYVLES